jgi:hypothetical protein
VILNEREFIVIVIQSFMITELFMSAILVKCLFFWIKYKISNSLYISQDKKQLTQLGSCSSFLKKWIIFLRSTSISYAQLERRLIKNPRINPIVSIIARYLQIWRQHNVINLFIIFPMNWGSNLLKNNNLES